MKPTTDFTITTQSGRVLSDEDFERMADAAASDTVDLSNVTFLRDFKGGYAQGVEGPMFAISLDSDLDARLASAADARGESAAALMRRAVAEFVDRPPATACAQPEADISGWQWILHLDAGVAERARQYAASSQRHINVVVNRAVGRLLDALDLDEEDLSR